MTLQAKGFQWSIGIHGAIFLIIAALQIPAVSASKLIVIDFSLSGKNPPAAVARSSLYQAQAMIQEPERAAATRPKEVVERHYLPNPEAEKLRASSEVPVEEEEGSGSPSPTADDTGMLSSHGETGSASLPGTTEVTGAPPAIGAFRNAAGSAQNRAGLSGNADAGTTPEISRAAYLKEHFAYIRDRITGGITYPHMARKMGWCGQVRIAFIVCEDGGVNGVRVVESSGFNLLDRNAVDTVKNVAPFPSPPVKAEIRMSITYRLQ